MFVRDHKKEKKLLSLLTVDESGFVIYEGPGTVAERTGSLATLLIDWYLYRNTKEKPLDAEIFRDLIERKLVIKKSN